MSGKGSISRMSDECLITLETAFLFYVDCQAVMRKFTLAGKTKDNAFTYKIREQCNANGKISQNEIVASIAQNNLYKYPPNEKLRHKTTTKATTYLNEKTFLLI